MKYLSTVEQEFQEHLDTFVNVEPYTELLNVSIRGSKLVLLFKGDYNCTNPHNNYEEKRVSLSKLLEEII